MQKIKPPIPIHMIDVVEWADNKLMHLELKNFMDKHFGEVIKQAVLRANGAYQRGYDDGYEMGFTEGLEEARSRI